MRRSDDSALRFQSHVPYQRTEVVDPSVYPYVVHGRIFSSYPDAVGFCSGTIVPDVQESLVLTAGHCLVDPETGAVADSISFAPGYRLGDAPYGYWNATAFGVTDQWKSSVAAGYADARYDVGAIKIAPDAQGVTLGDAFGWRGIQFNQDWEQTFTSFGYPGEAPFDGERLYSCLSTARDHDSGYSSGPYPIAMGCDMNQGSSGGGWVIGDGFVNSVVSYSLPDHSAVQFGPYFGATAQSFYESASGMDVPETPLPVTHQMRLGLTLKQHIVASGKLTSPDGYAPCTRGAPVEIMRKTSSGWRTVKQVMTNDYGQYRVKLPDRPGRYAAHSPKGSVDDLNLCSQATSVIWRHRH